MNEYRVSVSYSRTDSEIVGPLIQLLRIMDDRVFRDVDNIPAGSRWRTILTNAIDACEMLLVFWCCHSSNSVHVKKKCDQALVGSK
jgi:hypothetical protein